MAGRVKKDGVPVEEKKEKAPAPVPKPSNFEEPIIEKNDTPDFKPEVESDEEEVNIFTTSKILQFKRRILDSWTFDVQEKGWGGERAREKRAGKPETQTWKEQRLGWTKEEGRSVQVPQGRWRWKETWAGNGSGAGEVGKIHKIIKYSHWKRQFESFATSQLEETAYKSKSISLALPNPPYYLVKLRHFQMIMKMIFFFYFFLKMWYLQKIKRSLEANDSEDKKGDESDESAVKKKRVRVRDRRKNYDASAEYGAGCVNFLLLENNAMILQD